MHIQVLKMFAFQNHQSVVHTGARNWPAAKVFDMNTNHVSWLLRQEISGEAGVSLDDKLDILRLSQFAETTTSLQLCWVQHFAFRRNETCH